MALPLVTAQKTGKRKPMTKGTKKKSKKTSQKRKSY